ncbi:malonate decarboxylase subunit delta [Vagococcus lutrae]|uniref:malonate decarboxylase subunit delta n=1 Tax=Vagococcus lutrae TaxID=81947 RepID=UPI001C95A0F2|nr:malonate decarboxylase subunit delta [Vagococcus lutrae]QZN89241.1 malonate decarboxylase subunit delta [Vagococcus lutrae]
MEKLSFTYKTKEPIKKRKHVGVVASGDLEVLVNPIDHDETTVSVITGSDGFALVWENVLNRFFERYPIQAAIEINDFGATPGVVFLRLTQALEGIYDVEK